MTDIGKLVAEFVDACNAHDPEKAVAFFTADANYSTPSGTRHGTAEIRALIQAYVDATPDVHTAADALVVEGSIAALEWTDRGTQTGPFRMTSGDLPPTGRQYTLHGVSIIETKGDLIASWREYFDRLDLLTQLGLMPSPTAPTIGGQAVW